MNLGSPSAAGLANALRAVFCAPVSSGFTRTPVESSDTASMWIRTTCAGCNRSNTCCSMPLLLQCGFKHVLMRVYTVCQGPNARADRATRSRAWPRTALHWALGGWVTWLRLAARVQVFYMLVLLFCKFHYCVSAAALHQAQLLC